MYFHHTVSSIYIYTLPNGNIHKSKVYAKQTQLQSTRIITPDGSIDLFVNEWSNAKRWDQCIQIDNILIQTLRHTHNDLCVNFLYWVMLALCWFKTLFKASTIDKMYGKQTNEICIHNEHTHSKHCSYVWDYFAYILRIQNKFFNVYYFLKQARPMFSFVWWFKIIPNIL